MASVAPSANRPPRPRDQQMRWEWSHGRRIRDLAARYGLPFEEAFLICTGYPPAPKRPCAAGQPGGEKGG